MRPLLPPRSTAARSRDLERLAEERWDLVVVGAGSSGAAAARDAALRGMRVALVEQDDVAAGTSSRSSRLIHGGLRYLAQLDFGLVREGLAERRRLLAAAPGLVYPVRFLYTLSDRDPDPPWKVGLGLTLYDVLALGVSGGGLGRHRRLGAEEVLRAAPGLRREGLWGAFAYGDAATHDARLTVALAVAARDAGATVATRLWVRRLAPRSGGRVKAEIEDRITGRGFELGAGAGLLCCGPWADLLPQSGPRLRTARGSHLSFPRARLPIAAPLALRAPDRRLIFALPLDAHTVVGTTDEDDATPPASVCPTAGDTEYLLAAIEHAFPSAGLTRNDAVGGWAGLRPLLDEPGDQDPDALSRRHALLSGADGIHVLLGGKLTTHRRMAEEAIDRVTADLRRTGGPAFPRSATRHLALLRGSWTAGAARLRRGGLDEAQVEALAALYGARLERLAAAYEEERQRGGDGALERARLRLAVDEEWTLALDDWLLRRTAPGPLDLRAVAHGAETGAAALAAALDWSTEERDGQAAALRAGVAADLLAAGLEL